ncbi:Avr1b-1 avirulence-like protein [Phytophthora cinnamomi]|uniref:Avr1b-1 avirulence-like protein n=1 Tax=Phytophthora cinnamomi TaxID=4785 RepID=UPI002A338CCC|nr:Avr1b-1 avirulence-like protein [Phytophthora cinnamomi]KAJ8523980.1 hypothetical protein ON010_g17138 [Phytophthora cinnamomi]
MHNLSGDKDSIPDHENAIDASFEERTGNLESVLKKSASLSNLKSFTASEAEVNKLKTLLKETPIRGKMRALSMKEAEINKVKNIVAKNPKLRRATSLVSNPGKLTKGDLKIVEKFAKEHPKDGTDLIRSLVVISGILIVLGATGTVVLGVTAGKH